MATVGTASYDVELNRAKLATEVAGASRQIEAGLGASARRVTDQFSAAQRAAVAGFGAFAAAQGINSAIQAASNLAEQQAKVGEVFGSSAREVEAFAEGAAESIGQSERSALEAAGTFGNLFRAVGLTEQQSAQFSTTLTTLASDLASFNNTSVDDALTALRAGLVGETEPLKRFGVNLNEATLKAKALELGLSDGKAVLDANAKAQAAYALILEDTTLAQGDFERTSGSLANQQRILAAEFEDAQAKLGQELIPAAKLAVGVFTDLTRVVGGLPGPVVAGGLAIGGLVVAAGLLGPVIRTGVAELLSLTGAQATTATATTTATRAVDGQTAALLRNQQVAAQNAVAGSRLAAAARATGSAYTSAGGAMGILTKATGAATAAFVAFQVIDPIVKRVTSYDGDVEALARSLEDLAASGEGAERVFDQLGGSAEAFAKTIQRANSDGGFDIGRALSGAKNFGDFLNAEDARNDLKALDDQLTALYAVDPTGAVRAFRSVQDALIAQGVAQSDITNGLPNFTDALINNANAAESNAAAVDKSAEATAKAAEDARKTFDAQNEVAEANRNTVLAVDELNRARAAALGNSEEYRRATEAIADAEEEVADAQRNVARAQADLTDARKRAAEALDDLRLSAEGAVLGEERAQLRLEVAREEEQAVLNDPKATDRERREAILARKEAELALREAQDRRGDSQQDLAEAERRGVEGSPEVVAAKDRIADALDRQREAEERVADATKEAAEVLAEARAEVDEATRNLTDAVLDQAEAEANLAGATGDATAASDAYRDSLTKTSEFLDPNGAFRQRLDDYLETLREIDTYGPDGRPGRPTESSTLTGRDPAIPYRPTESSTLNRPGGDPALGGGRSVTVNVATGANPREIADAILWED